MRWKSNGAKATSISRTPAACRCRRPNAISGCRPSAHALQGKEPAVAGCSAGDHLGFAEPLAGYGDEGAIAQRQHQASTGPHGAAGTRRDRAAAGGARGVRARASRRLARRGNGRPRFKPACPSRNQRKPALAVAHVRARHTAPNPSCRNWSPWPRDSGRGRPAGRPRCRHRSANRPAVRGPDHRALRGRHGHARPFGDAQDRPGRLRAKRQPGRQQDVGN